MAGGGSAPSPDPDDDWEPGDRRKIDDEKFKKARAEGKIRYDDADYHHSQSQGGKSPAPKDPNEALRYSIKVSENSDRRIGVDVKNREFIVFDKTGESVDGTIEYHGHAREWNELHDAHRSIIRKVFNEVVTSKGKIVG